MEHHAAGLRLAGRKQRIHVEEIAADVTSDGAAGGVPDQHATEAGDGRLEVPARRAVRVHIDAVLDDALYLFALDGVRRALSAIARGEFFTPILTGMLDRVGILLAAAAVIAAFVVPALQNLIGAGPGHWIAFNVSALLLGALGLALTGFAGVVGQAARLKAELDEIF